tara:strand:- start:371 stop:625 length:255 start_codon:yes stop_codon:yes gene_type:complete
MTNIFYQWWEKHRKIVTFGGFLILLGLYVSPVIIEAKYKNICIKLSAKGALNKFKRDNIEDILLKETGLSMKELAEIEGYKNCL